MFTLNDKLKEMREKRLRGLTEPCPESIIFDLSAANLTEDAVKVKQIENFLRMPSTAKLLGNADYEGIGLAMNIGFIKDRRSARLVLRRIVDAKLADEPMELFATLPNFNFIEVVDQTEPTRPLDCHGRDCFTVIALLRWAYAANSFVVLSDIQQFLLTDVGLALFNEYQLLHLANRFNLPELRKALVGLLRTVEEIEEIRNDINYIIQLTDVDRAIVERYQLFLARYEKVFESEDATWFLLWDIHSDCSFQKSIETRFEPVDPEPQPEQSDGFDGAEIVDIF